MSKQDRFRYGVFYMLVSGIGLGCVSFFGKIGQEVFSIPALLFWRYLFAFLPSLAVFLFFQRNQRIWDRFWDQRLQFFRVFFVLLSQYCFFYYMITSSLLSATLLFSTGPLFIPLIDRWILKRYVGGSTWISTTVSFIGVLFVLPPNRDLLSWHSAIGLFAGLAQGISQVLFGFHLGDKKRELDFFSFYFFACVLSLIPYLIGGTTWAPVGGFGWKACFIVVGIGTASVFNQYFRALAFQESTPARLASFLYISIVVAAFFDWAVFNHIPTLHVTIGAVLILFGGILKIYLRSQFLRKKDQGSDLIP